MKAKDEAAYRERLKTWVSFLEEVQQLALHSIPSSNNGSVPYIDIKANEGKINYGYREPIKDFGIVCNWYTFDVGTISIPSHLRKIAEGKD